MNSSLYITNDANNILHFQEGMWLPTILMNFMVGKGSVYEHCDTSTFTVMVF
jgi:hypothetical protein